MRTRGGEKRKLVAAVLPAISREFGKSVHLVADWKVYAFCSRDLKLTKSKAANLCTEFLLDSHQIFKRLIFLANDDRSSGEVLIAVTLAATNPVQASVFLFATLPAAVILLSRFYWPMVGTHSVNSSLGTLRVSRS